MSGAKVIVVLSIALNLRLDAQFRQIGPAPVSPAIARQQFRALLTNVTPQNRQETLKKISDLISWYRDILDEELIAAWPVAVKNRLQSIYGTRVTQLARICLDRRELSQLFTRKRDAIAAEIVFGLEVEFATTLSDCLLRRTMLGLDCDQSAGDAEAAAKIGQTALGWSEQRVKEELVNYQRIIGSMSVPSSESSFPY